VDQITSQFKDFPGEAGESVADLCAKNIAAGMRNYLGPEVRFVGHSMGTQLAIRCAALMHEMKASAAPTRLVLTEAAFAPDQARLIGCEKKTIQGRKFGEWAIQHIHETMQKLVAWGVLTEYVQTLKGSTRMMIDGTESEDLQSQAVSVQYTPKWCHSSATKGVAHYMPILCTHDAAHALYMFSMANTGPCIAPTAACSTSELVSLLRPAAEGGRHPKWVQTSGEATIDTADDGFHISYEDDAGVPVSQRFYFAPETHAYRAEDVAPSSAAGTTKYLFEKVIIITLAVIACSCLVLCICGSKKCCPRKRRWSIRLPSYDEMWKCEDEREISVAE